MIQSEEAKISTLLYREKLAEALQSVIPYQQISVNVLFTESVVTIVFKVSSVCLTIINIHLFFIFLY
jgi:hypothetical protein